MVSYPPVREVELHRIHKLKPRKTSKIVGVREDAIPNEFGFIVRIKIDGEGVCGGTRIHEHFILTAAHCVYTIHSRLTMSCLCGSKIRCFEKK